MTEAMELGPHRDLHVCLNCNMTMTGLEYYTEHCRSQHDNHLCLMCQHSVCGLQAYIKHKTEECTLIKNWTTQDTQYQPQQTFNYKHLGSVDENDKNRMALRNQIINVLQNALVAISNKPGDLLNAMVQKEESYCWQGGQESQQPLATVKVEPDLSHSGQAILPFCAALLRSIICNTLRTYV